MILGICLQLIGQLSGATGYTVEEKLLGDDDDLDPTFLIGWEGFWLSAFWLLALPILQFIPCKNEDLCARGAVENTWLVFMDYKTNPILFVQSFCLALFTLIINVNGVTITKYGSAAQRTVVDQLRNITVWIYFLIFSVDG